MSSSSYYDVIIIGSGMAGLYAALQVKKLAPQLSFLVVEKYETYGGKSYNEDFENTSVVTGAGIGRFHKDKLLLRLMQKFKIPIHKFETGHDFIASIEPLCHVKTTFMKLKHLYNKTHSSHNIPHTTFKKFAIGILGKKEYDKFIMCAGYSDYENEDAYDTFYHYNFDDNYNRWVGFSVPWKTLVDRIVYTLESGHHIINNTEVTRILKHDNFFEVTTKHPHPIYQHIESKKKYYCEKVVIATDIDGITDLIHNISSTPELYYQIKGQPFLRLYAKFSKESIPFLKEKIQGVTIIPGPMQKVIPMDPDHGVYMIIYSDNDDADFFKKYFKNNEKNRNILNTMMENALDLKGKLRIENIKDFYWKNGTHYYTPLTDEFKTRQQFIEKAQHPEPNVLIVGEVISLHQGWVEGALESVEKTLTKKWLLS
jgi:thioredoxin reductase